MRSALSRCVVVLLDAAGRRVSLIAQNQKVGFCLMDTAVVDVARSTGSMWCHARKT